MDLESDEAIPGLGTPSQSSNVVNGNEKSTESPEMRVDLNPAQTQIAAPELTNTTESSTESARDGGPHDNTTLHDEANTGNVDGEPEEAPAGPNGGHIIDTVGISISRNDNVGDGDGDGDGDDDSGSENNSGSNSGSKNSNDSSDDSDSESTEDSASSSESSDENEEDLKVISHEALAEEARQMMAEAEDDLEFHEEKTYFGTEHEVEDEYIEPPDLDLSNATQLRTIGCVSAITGSSFVIDSGMQYPCDDQAQNGDKNVSVQGMQSSLEVNGEHDIRNSAEVLDFGSVVASKDKQVLGMVSDILGPVTRPMYVVRCRDTDDIAAKQIAVGQTILFVPSHASFVATAPLQSLKGSDASNRHDEEVEKDEMEFSDDEKEAQYKSALKKARKAKRSTGKSALAADQPNLQTRRNKPTAQTAPSRVDGNFDGPDYNWHPKSRTAYSHGHNPNQPGNVQRFDPQPQGQQYPMQYPYLQWAGPPVPPYPPQMAQFPYPQEFPMPYAPNYGQFRPMLPMMMAQQSQYNGQNMNFDGARNLGQNMNFSGSFANRNILQQPPHYDPRMFSYEQQRQSNGESQRTPGKE